MTDETIVNRMRELESKNGELTTEVVIADARDPDSPLHDHFDWDDEAAADNWRREQARRLIRSVRLVIHETQTTVRQVAYVRDPSKPKDEGGYVSTVTLRDDKDRARDALIYELQRAEAALVRAYDVSHALGLSNELEALRARVQGIRESA